MKTLMIALLGFATIGTAAIADEPIPTKSATSSYSENVTSPTPVVRELARHRRRRHRRRHHRRHRRHRRHYRW